MNKTSDNQLGYARKYLGKFESISVRMPLGTRERIDALGYKSANAFMVSAALERLEREESYRKKGEKK